MEIRPVAGAAEREACFDIFMRAMNDLEERRGRDAIDPADMLWMPTSLDHFGRTDPEGMLLALDGDDPVAFGFALRRETFWFLSYLFVLPAAQGNGLGRTLLERLLPAGPERSSAQLALVVEAAQPVSTMLYATVGISPRVPLYWLDGTPRPGALPAVPDGVAIEALSVERHADEIDRLDRKLLGYARPADHAMWIGQAQAARAYRADGELVGYGYHAPGDWICPIGALDEELTAAIVGDLASVEGGGHGHGDGHGDGKITVQVGGSAGTLLRLLLRAGLRSEEGAHLLYCSNGRVPPPSYVMYGGFLP
jgi:GNAT superfamily N-acetyltransferase